MTNCPYCGSAILGGGYECGTMRTAEGDVQTRFCVYVAEFRKPLDVKIADLETKVANRDWRIERLEAYVLKLETAGHALSVSMGCGCLHNGDGECATCETANRLWSESKEGLPCARPKS